MEIDFSDKKSIGRALREKGDGYVGLEFARENAQAITKLANLVTEQVAAQTKFMYASSAALFTLSVALIVLFFTR